MISFSIYAFCTSSCVQHWPCSVFSGPLGLIREQTHRHRQVSSQTLSFCLVSLHVPPLQAVKQPHSREVMKWWRWRAARIKEKWVWVFTTPPPPDQMDWRKKHRENKEKKMSGMNPNCLQRGKDEQRGMKHALLIRPNSAFPLCDAFVWRNGIRTEGGANHQHIWNGETNVCVSRCVCTPTSETDW